jgi:hypothetical protein
MRRVTRWGGARLARRLAVSVPYAGAAIALVALGSAIRRKGMLRGSVDTGLNAIPFVGATKNLIEIARGRDLLADRPMADAPPGTRAGHAAAPARERTPLRDWVRNVRL